MKHIVNAVEEFDMKNHWMTQGDRKGRTTLHHAAIYGYMNVVEFLVTQVIETYEDEELKSSFINVPDYKGRTPLFHAAVEKRSDVVRFLIERGANMEAVTNEKHIEPGSTVLMACAEKNSRKCFEILIEGGADILATRDDGADATYIAARYGHLDIIEQIAETSKMKSIVNRPTFRGRTALSTAAFHGHIQVCKVLFAKGADLNHRDENNVTALIYAADEGHFDVVKWLVENGADVQLKDNYEDTALLCAETNGYTEIFRYLQRFTCDDTEGKEDEKRKGKGKRRVTKGSLVSNKLLSGKNEVKRMSR